MIAFVRHGQTVVNAGGRLQGRLDAALSPLGRAQARALARLFRTEAVQRVVSSPLVRARDTAAAIADHSGCKVEVDDRLVELDYGTWDGISLRDVAVEDWEAWRNDLSFAPPGGESLADVAARVAAFLAGVASEPDELVVAVSHVSPIKAAVCLALGVDARSSWRMHLGLASITRIGRRPDATPYLLSFNETAHLARLA